MVAGVLTPPAAVWLGLGAARRESRQRLQAAMTSAAASVPRAVESAAAGRLEVKGAGGLSAGKANLQCEFS